MAAELIHPYNPEYQGKDEDHFIKKTLGLIIRGYLRFYHQMEVNIHPDTPKKGPYLVLSSHFSLLDTLMGMAADPYRPRTAPVVKESMVKAPVLGSILRMYEAIPVARDKNDIAAVREILERFKEGKGVCIAAEGTRSRTGRLGPMNKTLVSIALDSSRRGVPSIPMVENGTYEAFPPGALFPLPRKVELVTGAPIDLSPWNSKRVKNLSAEELAEAAGHIQNSIAQLLPEKRRPSPDTPTIIV